MGHANGTVPDFHGADRVFAAAHRLKEIAHVIAALVELDGAFRQGRMQQFLVVGLDRAAGHEDPAVRADELHAIRRLLAFADHVAICHGALIHDGHGYTVAVLAVDAELGGCGESTGNHFFERLPVDFDGAAPFGAVAPLGDVVVVSAPIGHLTTAEGIPPAEVPMAVLAVVGHHRRLADVVIPIQSLWNWLLRERAVHRARGQADDYVLKFAKATVADEFAGEPEIAFAALLAADLKDALVVAHGFHEALAFVDGEGERLLAVNILAGLHREQVYKRVPVVGRARDDGVDVVALHEFAKVPVLLRHLAVLRELFGRSL